MRTAPRVLAVFLMLLAASWSAADDRALVLGCIARAEAQHRLPAGLLLAIAKTESNLNWRALGRNRNGSHDVGLMQINTLHLRRLSAKGVTAQDLWHPCVNAMVGGMILREFIDRFGWNWKAVAAYNTGNPARLPQTSARYVARVRAHFERIQAADQGARHG